MRFLTVLLPQRSEGQGLAKGCLEGEKAGTGHVGARLAASHPGCPEASLSLFFASTCTVTIRTVVWDTLTRLVTIAKTVVGQRCAMSITAKPPCVSSPRGPLAVVEEKHLLSGHEGFFQGSGGAGFTLRTRSSMAVSFRTFTAGS